MFIWRFETKDGKGFYTADYSRTGRYQTPDRHPTINENMKTEINCGSDRRHGFRNITMTRKWFFDVDHINRCFDDEFNLVVFRKSRCTDIEEGNSQLVFKPGGKKGILLPSLLHSLKVNELHKLAIDAINKGSIDV